MRCIFFVENKEKYNNLLKPHLGCSLTVYYGSWKKKREGEQNKGDEKKNRGLVLVSELDSQQRALIVWFFFFSAYARTHSLFKAHMLKSHLPMQAHRLSRKKSPLSLSLSLECLRKPNVALYKTNKSFQGNRCVGWTLEMASRSPLLLRLGFEEDARQRAAPRFWEINAISATLGLFHTHKAFSASHSKRLPL